MYWFVLPTLAPHHSNLVFRIERLFERKAVEQHRTSMVTAKQADCSLEHENVLV